MNVPTSYVHFILVRSSSASVSVWFALQNLTGCRYVCYSVHEGYILLCLCSFYRFELIVFQVLL